MKAKKKMPRIKNKILKSAAAAISICLLSGCAFGDASYADIPGYAEITQAKKLYTELDSGHMYMQDNSSGEITEEFTFKYRGDGFLTYIYMGTDGEQTRYEFHNGSEINYKNSGDTEWNFLQQGNENYCVYDKKNKHPYTNEGVISMNAYAVKNSTVEDIKGGKKISLEYDETQFAESLSGLGELQSFDSVIWLNDEGYCYRLDQKGVFLNEGEQSVSDYSMFIDSMNEVGELIRPEV